MELLDIKIDKVESLSSYARQFLGQHDKPDVDQIDGLSPAVAIDQKSSSRNPRSTVTEFYDYRCPHCINMAPGIVALIKGHPEVRFVFKEMPIFGAASDHAAYAALAVKKDGGDYLGLYQAFMAAQPLDDQAVDRIAIAHGAKASDIPPNADNTAHLAATRALFDKLGMDGTPGFVIGDKIITGEYPDRISAAIAAAKKSAGM